MKRVFVTVGTTKFPKLIDAITTKDVLETLVALNYNFVQIQTGKDFSSVYIDPELTFKTEINKDNGSTILKFEEKITLKYDQYFENFEKQIENCDLVISHAGAGTCLEVLYKKKSLIVVINEDLMDNHQTELADELEKNGYLYYCTCNSLKDTLRKDLTQFNPYPKAKDFLFSNYVDKCMGFTV